LVGGAVVKIFEVVFKAVVVIALVLGGDSGEYDLGTSRAHPGSFPQCFSTPEMSGGTILQQISDVEMCSGFFPHPFSAPEMVCGNFQRLFRVPKSVAG
jgi:hypothetical protein